MSHEKAFTVSSGGITVDCNCVADMEAAVQMLRKYPPCQPFNVLGTQTGRFTSEVSPFGPEDEALVTAYGGYFLNSIESSPKTKQLRTILAAVGHTTGAKLSFNALLQGLKISSANELIYLVNRMKHLQRTAMKLSKADSDPKYFWIDTENDKTEQPIAVVLHPAMLKYMKACPRTWFGISPFIADKEINNQFNLYGETFHTEFILKLEDEQLQCVVKYLLKYILAKENDRPTIDDIAQDPAFDNCTLSAVDTCVEQFNSAVAKFFELDETEFNAPIIIDNHPEFGVRYDFGSYLKARYAEIPYLVEPRKDFTDCYNAERFEKLMKKIKSPRVKLLLELIANRAETGDSIKRSELIRINRFACSRSVTDALNELQRCCALCSNGLKLNDILSFEELPTEPGVRGATKNVLYRFTNKFHQWWFWCWTLKPDAAK